MEIMKDVITVVGLGYVGLPLARAFVDAGFKVFGYDLDHDKVTHAVKHGIIAERLPLHPHSGVYIIAVPTPVDADYKPNLSALSAACETVGAAMRSGAIVVLESTVAPGTTESVCVPILEESSGLRHRTDFSVGYSPERINPGDKQHTLANTNKLVAGDSRPVTSYLVKLYENVVTGANVVAAKSIRAAEMSKLVENAQRDVNIAFVNDVAATCEALGIDVDEVLDLAGTKWNFARFRPGLVGGHCIGVDPYYLINASVRRGYYPTVIATAREYNENLAPRICFNILEHLQNRFNSTQLPSGIRISIIGGTFKPDVDDFRNSQAVRMGELLSKVARVDICDPYAPEGAGILKYETSLPRPVNCVIYAVAHEHGLRYGAEEFRSMMPNGGLFVDIAGLFKREEFEPYDIAYWRMG